MRGKHIELVAGIAIGAVLFGGGTAFAAGLLAEPSTQTFYLGSQQIELEAYAINGHNYVKLRDVGQAVDFNVAYDPARNAAIIEPDKPYTGENVVTATPSPKPAQGVDYAAQANPTIFGGELKREVYNAIRDTVVNRDAILTGSYPAVPMGNFPRNGAVDEAVAAIGGYPVYDIVSTEDGGYACTVKCPSAYEGAVEHTQGFIDGLAGMGDREKVTAMAWYVADRITYSVAYPSPAKVLNQDEQIPGACMAYAYSFRFLCDRAGIPCILKRGGNHQWNMVYVDGQWWDVDVTANDAGDDATGREYSTVLHDPDEHRMAGAVDEEPEVTAFVQELLVPGSTK